MTAIVCLSGSEALNNATLTVNGKANRVLGFLIRGAAGNCQYLRQAIALS